jgi:ribosomal protein S24E
MKIFNDSSSQISQSPKGDSKKLSRRSNRRTDLHDKPSVSDSEIRDKLAAHVETSNTAKMQMKKNNQKFGDSFLNESKIPAKIVRREAIAEEAPAESSPSSDIALNDPKSPETQEKLKSVLSKGAFNFNSKEREALDKILNAD